MREIEAEDALAQFEAELGLRSPETSALADTAKNLGPAVEADPLTDKNYWAARLVRFAINVWAGCAFW